MQLTEEQVINILYDYSVKITTKDAWTLGVVNEANFKDVARQILSKIQSNSDIAAPLQQANVMQAQSAEPLALLEQELNRLATARPTPCIGMAGYDYDKKIGRVQNALQLIRELTEKANGA